MDPREIPDPPLRVSVPPRAPTVSEILELLRLCREGRIYEVERWIRAGKPLQAIDYRHGARRHRHDSALKIAIEKRHFDLAHLLLCNGFIPDLEDVSLVDLVLTSKATDYLDLLLAWGADPKRASPEVVLGTHSATLIRRFWDFGVDYTRGHRLADVLSRDTGNRAAYGWARKHREDPRVARELAIALGEAIGADREKAVALLLWAGADPHLKAPSLPCDVECEDEKPDYVKSAVEWAVCYGRGKLLSQLKPDPAKDDFEGLWQSVDETGCFDVLAAIQLPKDWNAVLLRHVRAIVCGYGLPWRSRWVIEAASYRHEARITVIGPDLLSVLQKGILRTKDGDDLRWVMRWMARPENCDPVIYRDVVQNPEVRNKLMGIGGFRHPKKPERLRPRSWE